MNQLLKIMLPLDGRLFFLLSPHQFPLLSETRTWKPLCCNCIPVSLGKALILHWQFTLQGPFDFQKVYLAYLSEKSNLLSISSKWHMCSHRKQENHRALQNSNFTTVPHKWIPQNVYVFLSFWPWNKNSCPFVLCTWNGSDKGMCK